jgi:hypothetical protein
MTAVAVKNKSEILKRVAAGDKITDIGKSYGVTQQAISKQLLKDPEWVEARMSGTLARIEHWEKEIEAINEGTSQVVLGRAREMLSHARWRAEREFPSQWGSQKMNINIGCNSVPTTSEALEKDIKELVAQIAVVE